MGVTVVVTVPPCRRGSPTEDADMDPTEQTPLLEAEDDLSNILGGPSAVTQTDHMSHQNPVLHPVLIEASYDVVDGVIPVSGHSHKVDKEDPFTEENLNGQEVKTKTYLSRIWILCVFSAIAWFQCLQWNTWGPLSESVNVAFSGWGSDTVAMMANWGTITFVSFVGPMCWLMNTKGLRVGVVFCGALVAGGTVLRIVPFVTNSTEFFTAMCHICAIMVGTAGTLIMAAPPLIAAEWFPPKERTTATAVSQALNQLGSAGSYMEPLLVRNPTDATSAEIRNDIKRLMYIYAGVGVSILVAILVYFPPKPPTPPSVTSFVERLDFKSSVNKMFRNRELLLVTLSYGLCIGIPSAWISVLNYSLYDLGMHQNDAMWVGLLGVLVSGSAGLVVGRMTDLVYGHVKLSLLVLIVASMACFYWFYLLAWGSITVSKWQIYFSVVGGLSFNFATAPLFFELAVESAYPCSEVTVGGLITGANNFVGLLFLFIFLIPNIGYQWVTYLLLGTSAVSILPLLFVKEDYSRSTIDRCTLP